MVGDILSFRIAYWEKEDEPGTLWANKRTMLGFALPRVDPMCSTSCLKACEHLALLAVAFWVELGLNLPQRSDAWRASSWSLFPGKSVFLGKKQTCSSLPGFYGSHIHTVLQLPLRNEQANRNPDFFFGIVFLSFSNSISLQSSNFLPFVFDCVKEIEQASTAHFKNEMLSYIAFQ